MARSPAPQPRPGSDAAKVTSGLGIGPIAPKGSGSTDPFGLGGLKDTPLAPGGLLPVITDSTGLATADKIMQAFLNAGTTSPGLVAQIQQQMYASGAYAGNYNPLLHPGLIRPEDVSAFASTLKVVAQQVTSGSTIDLKSYLGASASFGASTGKAAASVNYQTDTHVVTHQDPNVLNLTADSVAQQILGRKPTAQEKARFAAWFDTTDVGRQMKVYNAQDASSRAYVQRQLDDAAGQTATPGAAQIPSFGPPSSLAATDSFEVGPNTSPALIDRAVETRSAPPQAEPTVDKFMQAIGGQESGGNYRSVNTDSGAAGKFQIMPGNWPSWSREAGLGPNASRTPQNQDRVARFKMQQYKQQFGSWQAVAVAWYAGPAAAAEWLRHPQASRFTRPQQSNGRQYPSINTYVDQVTARMGSTGVLAPLPPTGDTFAIDQPNIPISQRVDVTDTNPAADAEAFFRSEHPLEASGKDVANTFNTFMGILKDRG